MRKLIPYIITIAVLANLIAGITGICPFLHRLMGLN